MRILFDHGTPAPLIAFLVGHTVTKAKGRGLGRVGKRRAYEGGRECRFRGFAYDRQEYGVAAEFENTHDCDCGAREFAMADRATLRPEDSCDSERRDARQLREIEIPFR
jgi:hypothetical protein